MNFTMFDNVKDRNFCGVIMVIRFGVYLILFLSIASIFNPSDAEHINRVKGAIKGIYYQNNPKTMDDMFLQSLKSISRVNTLSFFDGYIDEVVYRDNYFIFSLTRVKDKDSNIIGYGLFGKVYLVNSKLKELAL
jgi:hypothetical protein